jgi:tryptophan synthase alpha chain
MATTGGLLRDFESRGVRICELGIPFSDPIADGPTIQGSYTEALAGGTTSKKIFELTSKYRTDGGQLALVAMVSYSIVYRHGVAEYLTDLRGAGFDGLIIPDLSLEEAPALERAAASKGLANIMLIAPTTPQDRRLEIARHSRGFIYYISVAGITGERDKLPEGTIDAVGELRKHTDTPVCVGFGISKPEMVTEVCKVADADGAIVGSALVRRISDLGSAPLDQRVKELGEFVSTLIQPLK